MGIANEPSNGIHGSSHALALPGKQDILIENNTIVVEPVKPGKRFILGIESPEVPIPINFKNNTIIGMLKSFKDPRSVGDIIIETGSVYQTSRAAAGLSPFPYLPSTATVNSNPYITNWSILPTIGNGSAKLSFSVSDPSNKIMAVKVYKTPFDPYGCGKGLFKCKWELFQNISAPSGLNIWQGEADINFEAGVFLIRLEAENIAGDNSPSLNFIQVINNNFQPLACSASPTTVGFSEQVTFTAVGGGQNKRWSGTDKKMKSNTDSFTVSYISPGIKNMTVSDGNSTAVCSITVVGPPGDYSPPVISAFKVQPTTGGAGPFNFTFVATDTGGSHLHKAILKSARKIQPGCAAAVYNCYWREIETIIAPSNADSWNGLFAAFTPDAQYLDNTEYMFVVEAYDNAGKLAISKPLGFRVNVAAP